MSRKLLAALGAMLGCGVVLLGLLPRNASEPGGTAGWAKMAQHGVVDPAVANRVRAALRSAPLQFEANVGQTDGRVKYTARGAGYVLFLTPEEAVVSFHKPFVREKRPIYLEARDAGASPDEPIGGVVRMKFVGANTSAAISGQEARQTHVNYFLGKDPRNWRRDVPGFGRVKYEGIYPGVDALFYGEARHMEYDFVVKPGANPGAIAIGFEGADQLTVEANEVVAHTRGGDLRLTLPQVYQVANGIRLPVTGKFVRRGSNEIGFEVGAYDAAKNLVIDPQVTPTGSALQLGTYYGGIFEEAITSIAVGTNGQVYVAGYTDTNDGSLPIVGAPLPFQGTFQGSFDCSQFPQHPCGDAFVATFNIATGALVAATYLGGAGDDVAWGLALDAANDPYIVGESDSGNFPTTAGAFQQAVSAATCGSGSRTRPCRHAFFTKMDPALTTLMYSTMLAGTDDDSAFAVAVSSGGQAFITGVAGFGFTTVTAAGGTYSGAGDAFVAEVDPALSLSASLVYAEYLGGSGTDAGLTIAVNANKDAFVGGVTFSTVNSSIMFPTTANAVQPATPDGVGCGVGGGANCGDGFITEIDPTGTTLLYSTFLGGGGTDQVNAIALDGAGKIYVTGATRSGNFPTTAGAFNTTGSFAFDAFASKVDPTVAGLPGLVYSTYLAGSNDDSGNALAIDSLGNAFIAGTTNSPDYPVNLAMQASSRTGNPTAFVTSLNTTGTALNFSTYYGGTNSETGRAIALDANGLVYLGGSSNSSDLCTAKAFQPLLNNPGSGQSDAILTIINPTNTSAACVQMTNGTVPPGPVNFNSVSVGTTSNPMIVFLLNEGSNAMTFSTPISGPNAGDFKETDTCAGTVAGGTASGSCSLGITFTPTAAGGTTETATMTITTTGLVPTTVINLTGIALGAPPVTVTPNPLTFLPEVVGTTEAPLTVTISNTGTFGVNAPLTVTNIALGGTNPGDFALSPLLNFANGNQCFFFVPVSFPITVFQGSSCVFSVTFTPTAQNPTPRTATLTVTDNGTTPTQTININGPTAAGNGPNIALSGPLSFGSVIQATPSASQVLTITNSGGANMTVNSVGVAGDYAAPTTCLPSAPLTPGGTCTVTVTFTPTALGLRPGTLTITDTAPGSPHLVSLTGTGIPPGGPAITLSSAVNFGQQVLNTTSGAQPVTINNSGAAAMTITSIAAGGDYAQANNCPASLAVGTSCTANVTFTPTGLGARIGSLTITDNAPGSPHLLSLTGTGIANGGPGISLSSPLSFGPVLQNTPSPAQAVGLTNNGVSALTVTSIVASGDYAQVNNCPVSVAPGAGCIINVTFTPTALGTRNGTVTITDNALGSPHIVSLTGVGTSPAGGPGVSLTSSLFFGGVILNSASPAQSVTITNNGGAPLAIASIAAGGDFAATNTCPASLGIGASCNASVIFTPTVIGLRMGTLTITDNAVGSPQTVALSGTGAVFTVNAPAGSGLNATVNPGDTAVYKLTLAATPGFVGTVNLTCGNNPPTTICTISPSSLTLNGTAPVTVMVMIRTNCVTTQIPPGPFSLPPGMPPQIVVFWMFALLALAMVRRLAPDTRLGRLAPVLGLVLLMVTLASCGSAAPPALPGQPQTPAGGYNIIVNATSGSVNQQILLSLRVT